jgi:hypothetical protein
VRVEVCSVAYVIKSAVQEFTPYARYRPLGLGVMGWVDKMRPGVDAIGTRDSRDSPQALDMKVEGKGHGHAFPHVRGQFLGIVDVSFDDVKVGLHDRATGDAAGGRSASISKREGVWGEGGSGRRKRRTTLRFRTASLSIT